MGAYMNYHGDIGMENAQKCIEWLLKNKKIYFVNSVSAEKGFNVLLKEKCMSQMEDDDIAYFRRNVCMVGNNTVFPRVFDYRIARKYDLMYSQKAYVHWYIGEGMEEGEFAVAREDLGFLEKDYWDVRSDISTEEAEDDSDE